MLLIVRAARALVFESLQLNFGVSQPIQRDSAEHEWTSTD
jgi:hypothetical protein